MKRLTEDETTFLLRCGVSSSLLPWINAKLAEAYTQGGRDALQIQLEALRAAEKPKQAPR